MVKAQGGGSSCVDAGAQRRRTGDTAFRTPQCCAVMSAGDVSDRGHGGGEWGWRVASGGVWRMQRFGCIRVMPCPALVLADALEQGGRSGLIFFGKDRP